jgi:hypothetical protein
MSLLIDLDNDAFWHYLSRSAADLDDKCGHARFESTLRLGGGLSPQGTAPELAFGTAIHLGPQTIWATGGDLEAADRVIQESSDYATLMPAHQFLVRCLSYAYGLSTYVRLRDYWKLIATEREVRYTIGKSSSGTPIVCLAQPDLLLEHIETGIVLYDEFKSTKLLTDRYLNSWKHAIQLVVGALAVKETMGITIDQFRVSLFYKGEQGDDYWRSPFTSGWVEPCQEGKALYAPKRPPKFKGWERFDVHESHFTPRQWVEELISIDPMILPAQLPTVDVPLDPIQVQSWQRQIAYREQIIADFVEEHDYMTRQPSQAALDRVFKKRFNACEPAMGSACPFLAVCKSPVVAQSPLRHGYQRRQSHHAIEAAALEKRWVSLSEREETTRV